MSISDVVRGLMPSRATVQHVSRRSQFFLPHELDTVRRTWSFIRVIPARPMIGPALLTGAAILNVVGGLVLRREEPSREREAPVR